MSEHQDPDTDMGAAFERDLMVKLTKKEVDELHDELTTLCTDIEEKEAARKLASSKAGEEIGEKRKAYRAVLKALNTGARPVSVKCREYFRFRTNTVVVKRLDTGEEVETREMTAVERQARLFDLDGGKDEKGGDGSSATVAELSEARKKASSRKGKGKSEQPEA